MQWSVWEEAARPRAVREHPQAAWLAVGAVCVGAFMGQLDASIVTLTFPALESQFHAPLAAVQWVSLSYLLALVALVTPAGRIADSAGRKLMYLYGFVIFTLASAACGLAATLGMLVVFRVIQAVGAALLQANSVALVVTSVPRESTRKALSVQAAAQALGLALGPTVGGVLVGSQGWRSVFWVNAPIGCIALVSGYLLLPRTRGRTPLGDFDWAGLILLVGASAGALMTLSALSGLPVSGGWKIALFIIAASSFMGLLIRERRAASPLVDVTLLRPRTVSIGLVGALCGYVVLFAPLALYPQVLGDTPRVGLLLTALPAGFASAALFGDRVIPPAYGTRARAVLGAALCVGAAVVLVFVEEGSDWVGLLLMVLGLGLGLFIPANNTTIMDGFPTRAAAMGGGMVNMTRGVGTSLGVALVALCLHLTPSLVPAASGARLALAAVAFTSVVAATTGLTARIGTFESSSALNVLEP